MSAAFVCFAPTALADDAASLYRAEELFREGKALLGARDYPKACPILASNLKLDPGTGTLLALAICHEGEGKLASASAEYKVAAERAKAEGRADRELVARDRARALESRLSTLVIVPPPEARNTDDFVIRRSGVVVERDAWDKPIALDGGDYVIQASAPGKKPWRAEVTLAPSTERRTVTVPPLEDVAAAEPMVGASPAAPRPQPPMRPGPRVSPKTDRGDEPDRKEDGPTALRLIGIGGMAAGALGIGIGTVYAFRAMSMYEDSNKNGCDGDTCVGQGKADRLAARSAGNTATVGFAIGTPLAVGGAVAFVLGTASDDDVALRPRVSIESREVGLSLDGSF
jgi:hypothetical protein